MPGWLGVRGMLVPLLLLTLFVLARPAKAASPTPPPTLSPGAGVHVDLSPLDTYLRQLQQESHGTLPGLRAQDFVDMMFHGKGLSLRGLLSALLRYFFQEVWQQTGLLGRLLVLGVAAALLEHVGRSFQSQEAAKFAQAVAYLALVAVALQAFSATTLYIRTAIQNITGLMEAVLPLLTTLLAALGSFSTIALLRPVMLVTANLIGLFLANWVIPAIFLATVVELTAQLTGMKLSGLSGLLRQLGTVSLGLGLTVFLAVVAIFRLVGPVTDSVFLRTGKFMANAFIPVVGKLFSDAAEVVFGSTFLLKNAVGITGLFIVLMLTLLPLLKLFAVVFVYRLSGALLGPVGAGPIADALITMANNLVLVAVALGALSLMFFIAMTLVFAGGRGLVG